MADTTAYSCPNCHAPVKLDPSTGLLSCEYCGGSFDPNAMEQRVGQGGHVSKVEKQPADPAKSADPAEPAEPAGTGAQAGARDDAAGKAASGGSGPISRTVEDWEALIANGQVEQFQDVVGYTCPNCGAQVVSDKLTVAASCQYCGSSVVVDQRLTGGLKPGYVIPFRVKAKDLPQMLTDFYKDKPLLPKNFFYENQVGEVQGLYVPFWLYDGHVDGAASYVGTTSRVYISGRDQVTETTHMRSERVGSVEFRRIPVDASERIDDDLMDSIEPFDYQEMKPFIPAYLTGFVAERFDQSPRQVLERASSRMEMTVQDLFASSVGYGASTESAQFHALEIAASYVLLPVYLFNCMYQGTHYRYAVNGQTGKIVGEVPIGKRESRMAFLKGMAPWVAAGVIALLAFVGSL